MNAERPPRPRPDRPGTLDAPLIVKIGGRALESAHGPRELAGDLAGLGGGVVLVHGGGAAVSDWSARLGILPRFIDGLRVTDPETLEVAVAVLSGLANKRLVASLRDAGADAVGLSALDGGIVGAVPHPDRTHLGHVGAVRSVDPALLEMLLRERRLPVVASIAAHAGELLNLNADDLAAALAGALEARALILLSDIPGVRLDGAVVPEIGAAELDLVRGRPEVSGGMIAKLGAARAAIESGAGAVHIAAWQGAGTLAALLEGSAPGTRIVPEPDAAAGSGRASTWGPAPVRPCAAERAHD